MPLAYIDPGTGSYLFQAAVGAILGGALAVKVFWRRIWGFLSGRRRRERSPEPAETE